VTVADDGRAVSLFALVSRSGLFTAGNFSSLELLTAQATYHEARRNSIIATRDQPFPYLGIVAEGLVAITVGARLGRGRRTHVYEARAGETFAEIAALSGVPPIGDITVASRRAAFALIPAAALSEIVRRDPQLGDALLKRVAERSRALAARLLLQQKESVAARVSDVLLRFAAEGPGLQPASADLQQITQHEIAAMAGCVKEAAARAIGKLDRAGALRREHGHITHLSRELLLHERNGGN
jgi:CRP-like cAMP-binding protein